MNTRLIGIAAVTLWLAAGVARAAEPPADLVVVGAAIATLDPARPEATALAVRGDRIVAVGSDAEIAAFAGPATRRLEAGGRRVVPGFIEGHGHFMSLGESLGTLDLRGARALGGHRRAGQGGGGHRRAGHVDRRPWLAPGEMARVACRCGGRRADQRGAERRGTAIIPWRSSTRAATA